MNTPDSSGTRGSSGGLGCALVIGGIFLLVGVILGVVGFVAGDTTAHNYSTGQSDAIGGTLVVLAAVFSTLGLAVIVLGIVMGRRTRGS